MKLTRFIVLKSVKVNTKTTFRIDRPASCYTVLKDGRLDKPQEDKKQSKSCVKSDARSVTRKAIHCWNSTREEYTK